MTGRQTAKALITGGTGRIERPLRSFCSRRRQSRYFRKIKRQRPAAGRNWEAATFYEADITNEAEIAASIDFTVQTLGKLDILFNNAGGPVGAPLEELSQNHIDYGVKLLFSSVILGTRYAIEPMKKNGGGVIINNSRSPDFASPRRPLYSALKAGVTHFTRMSGIELGPFNIRVNSISPEQ